MIAMSLADKLLGAILPPGTKTLVGILLYAGAHLLEQSAPHVLNDQMFTWITTVAATLGGIGVVGKIDRGIEAMKADKQPAAKWDDFLQG
jgi:hypothetical protein